MPDSVSSILKRYGVHKNDITLCNEVQRCFGGTYTSIFNVKRALKEQAKDETDGIQICACCLLLVDFLLDLHFGNLKAE